MIQKLWVKVAVATFHFDRALSRILRQPGRRCANVRLDGTGCVVRTPLALRKERCTSGAWLVEYPGQAGHSIWRSQEFSLIDRYRRYLQRPRLDFGCGDGSFGAALFDRVDIGVDHDAEALRLARRYSVYEHVFCCEGWALPLRKQSVCSVISNSTLEHVDDVVRTVGELHDILVPDGHLVFSVPVSAFATHLTRHFGRQTSETVNRIWYHRHLYSPQWWRALLDRQGFDVELIKAYQPEWFTVAYFALTTRPLRLLYRMVLGENGRWRRMMGRMIAASLESTTEGANIFVIARRRR